MQGHQGREDMSHTCPAQQQCQSPAPSPTPPSLPHPTQPCLQPPCPVPSSLPKSPRLPAPIGEDAIGIALQAMVMNGKKGHTQWCAVGQGIQAGVDDQNRVERWRHMPCFLLHEETQPVVLPPSSSWDAPPKC